MGPAISPSVVSMGWHLLPIWPVTLPCEYLYVHDYPTREVTAPNSCDVANDACPLTSIGNSDVVEILNHILSYGSGEDVNANNIGGEMNCQWYFANNTTMRFVVRNNDAVRETGSP